MGGLKKEVQIKKKPNSATIVYVFSGGGYIKPVKNDRQGDYSR